MVEQKKKILAPCPNRLAFISIKLILCYYSSMSPIRNYLRFTTKNCQCFQDLQKLTNTKIREISMLIKKGHSPLYLSEKYNISDKTVIKIRDYKS